MSNFRTLVSAALIARAAAQHHHGMNPFEGSNCTCDTFCNKGCDIEKTPATNMTLFRMTQFGVVDMTNKNTGDIPGDTSFVISRRTQAYECRQNPASYQCGSNMAQFQGDVPNCTDLVLQWTIEVDGNWGPYQYCNPLNSSEPASTAGGINVGWDCLNSLFSSHGSHGRPPPNYPLQCSSLYDGYEGFCFSSQPSRTISAATLADCCHDAAGDDAHSWTYVNGSCKLYHYGMGAKGCAGGVSGMRKYTPRPGPPPPPPCNCKRMNETMGLRNMSGMGGYGGSHFGIWYSSPAMGECRAGHYVGDGSGCTWRAVGIQKAINASCLYNHIDTYIEESTSISKSCFSSCPPAKPGEDPKMTDCYLKCYSESARQLNPAQLSEPWKKAFAGEVIADGGCPVVHQICPPGSTRPGCPPHGRLVQATDV